MKQPGREGREGTKLRGWEIVNLYGMTVSSFIVKRFIDFFLLQVSAASARLTARALVLSIDKLPSFVSCLRVCMPSWLLAG